MAPRNFCITLAMIVALLDVSRNEPAASPVNCVIEHLASEKVSLASKK
jgi:hypothetical protein